LFLNVELWAVLVDDICCQLGYNLEKEAI
jgi:hypothetical protein